MIRTVFFDIGNVLVFFSLPKMVSQLAACTGLAPQEIQSGFFETDLRERYEKGLLTTEELYQIFREKSSQSFTRTAFESAFANIFTLNEELIPIVKKLKAAKIELILLSNTSPCHFEFIDKTYLLSKFFPRKILSYELGICKPDARIFHEALRMAGRPAKECFYIDDVPHFVSTANKAGLPAELFIDAPTLQQQLILRGLL